MPKAAELYESAKCLVKVTTSFKVPNTLFIITIVVVVFNIVLLGAGATYAILRKSNFCAERMSRRSRGDANIAGNSAVLAAESEATEMALKTDPLLPN